MQKDYRKVDLQFLLFGQPIYINEDISYLFYLILRKKNPFPSEWYKCHRIIAQYDGKPHILIQRHIKTTTSSRSILL
jgi:hypothetical protein